MDKFKALGLSENVLEALKAKGFKEPTPIQEKTIPLLLKGNKDIVGQAQTGTGKTGAFGLPLIDLLDDTKRDVQALILCPTRELALQVAEEITSFKGRKKLWVQAVYGGANFGVQARALEKGTQIVVGTPGRIRDHIERGTLLLDKVTHVVLDEADEMLNMGFEEEVRDILKHIPPQRRMLLFSATMPPAILKIARTYMGDYDMVAIEKKQVTADLVDQIYFEVNERDRFETLCRIIDTEPEFYGIVFCRTKAETDEVADKLIDRGYDAEAIHGDVTQFQREQTLKKFKMRKIVILVATDVAARGIDINDLTHVVNYSLPQDPEAYIHRIGRTGRAGKHGTAISIITPAEKRELLFIQKIARTQLRREEVPGVDDVIATKKMKIKTDLANLLEHKGATDYLELAHELLEDDREPAQVLSAILYYTFRDTLKPSAYREIGKINRITNTSDVRLFVAKGHTSNLNAASLVQFIADEAGIDPKVIRDVRVYDNFSFITVPAEQAEQILVVFSKNKRGGKPLVSRAREKDNNIGNLTTRKLNERSHSNRRFSSDTQISKGKDEKKGIKANPNDKNLTDLDRSKPKESDKKQTQRDNRTLTRPRTESAISGRNLQENLGLPKGAISNDKKKRTVLEKNNDKQKDTDTTNDFTLKFDEDLSW
ncbi:MAG: DEAD/DEAH box helicase [Chitinophagales bacterium]|nr:DEAD/DEAH box helicase [Chitinophagales bacterium]MDW8274357.1 DEAD/DEAH box helicase [Chitinophagales bacterium]